MHTRHYRCDSAEHSDRLGCLVCQLYTEINQMDQEIEDYKAANKELQFKVAIAQAEVDGYLRRHDADRRRIVELETQLAKMAGRITQLETWIETTKKNVRDNSFAEWLFDQAPEADHD